MNKKIGLLLVVLVMVLSLVVISCAPAAEPTPGPGPTTAPTTAPTTKPTPTPAPEAEVVKWRLTGPWAAGTTLYIVMEDFAQRVSDMTDCNFQVEVYAGGAICPMYEEYDALNEGYLDAYACGPSAAAGIFGSVSRLFVGYPGGLNVYELLAWLYEGGGNEMEQEVIDRKNYNVTIVGPMAPNSAEGFGWFKERITSLDQFKGMKFRTASIWGEILSEELGAAVVQIPAGELYEAFMRGTIDAFEFSTPKLDWDYAYQELDAVYMMPGIHQTCTLQSLNVCMDSWEALSPEYQAIIRAASDATCMTSLMYGNYQDGVAYQMMLDYGVEIYDLPEDVQRGILKASVPVYARYCAEDPLFDKIFNSQKEFKKLYGACQTRITDWVSE